jgi:hypothetical protein
MVDDAARTLRSPVRVRLAAARSVSVRLGVEGVPGAAYALARSAMARDALAPNFRPSSSRFFVSGSRNAGPSRSSGVPSSLRGVARSVPHVMSGGRSSGSGSASSAMSE